MCFQVGSDRPNGSRSCEVGDDGDQKVLRFELLEGTEVFLSGKVAAVSAKAVGLRHHVRILDPRAPRDDKRLVEEERVEHVLDALQIGIRQWEVACVREVRLDGAQGALVQFLVGGYTGERRKQLDDACVV